MLSFTIQLLCLMRFPGWERDVIANDIFTPTLCLTLISKKKTPPKPSPFTWRLRGIYIQILPLWKFQMHSQDNILVNFQLHYWFYAGFSLDTQSLQLRQFISEADAGNDILLMKRPCIWTSFTPSWRNKMKEQDEVILKAPHP